MSEENTVQVTPNPADGEKPEVVEDKNAKLKGLSQEDLVDIVLSLRQENAKHRTEKNAAAKDLEEYQKWKDSQKSELEKLQEENATLKKNLKETSKEKRQREIGTQAKLDPDLWEFIKGSSDDEMLASAQKLAEKYPAAPGNANPANVAALLAGNRGTPVNEGTIDANEMANVALRKLLNQ